MQLQSSVAGGAQNRHCGLLGAGAPGCAVGTGECASGFGGGPADVTTVVLGWLR